MVILVDFEHPIVFYCLFILSSVFVFPLARSYLNLDFRFLDLGSEFQAQKNLIQIDV